jgi:ribonuclease P protein subunit RPR2
MAYIPFARPDIAPQRETGLRVDEIGYYSLLSSSIAVRRRKDSHRVRDLALQRMERLFSLAASVHEAHPERSRRYVQIACRISTRTRVRMPRPLKRLFCKHCEGFLSPVASRVRLRQGILITTCLSCGGQMRRPFKPEIRPGQD